MTVALALALTATLQVGCSRNGAGGSARFGSGYARVGPKPGIEKLEREMLERLNRDRAERGLPALHYDSRLADVARAHSTDMRDHHFFAHESPNTGTLDNRLDRAGYLFLTARENLAEAPNVQIGQDSLLKSPGHYANIVATDVTRLGIGIVRGGVEASDNLTITQVFAAPAHLESPESARRTLINQIQSERSKRGLPKAVVHPGLNEIALAHLSELEPEPKPSTLQSIGKKISNDVAARREKQLRGVMVSAETLPDGRVFEVPPALLAGARAPFGIAVRKVAAPSGRPMLQVLLLIGQ